MAQTNWPRFFLSYLALGILGTAALAALCPFLDLSAIEPPPAVRAFLDRLDASPTLQAAVRSVRNGFAWRYHGAPAPPEPEERPTPPVLSPSRPEPTRPEPTRAWFMPATVEAPEPPAPPLTPPTSGVQVVQMWGVVVRPSAPTYDRTGKFLQKVKAGTVLDVTELWKTKSGDLVLGEAITDSTTLPNTLIRLQDLDLRTGPLVKVPFREKELRSQLGEILAQREDFLLEQRRKSAQRTDNPNFAAYVVAQQAYSNFWRKVKALEAKRDTLTGAERSQCIDEMAHIRASREDEQVGKALEAAKALHDEWNAAHPAPPPEPDAKLAEINLKIMGLRSQIEGLPRPQ